MVVFIDSFDAFSMISDFIGCRFRAFRGGKCVGMPVVEVVVVVADGDRDGSLVSVDEVVLYCLECLLYTCCVGECVGISVGDFVVLLFVGVAVGRFVGVDVGDCVLF